MQVSLIRFDFKKQKQKDRPCLDRVVQTWWSNLESHTMTDCINLHFTAAACKSYRPKYLKRHEIYLNCHNCSNTPWYSYPQLIFSVLINLFAHRQIYKSKISIKINGSWFFLHSKKGDFKSPIMICRRAAVSAISCHILSTDQSIKCQIFNLTFSEPRV